MDDKALRAAVVNAVGTLNETGLSKGTSGNVSVRSERGCLITPSGVSGHDIVPNSIVELDPDGNVLSGSLLPSSEWRFHAAIYRSRHQVGAVVHCHSMYATSLAVHSLGIPAFHYMVAAAGGADIRCAGYATFGTEALSELVVDALQNRKACLMAHHGQVAVGPDLDAALGLAAQVEELAAWYWHALQLGEPPGLSDAEMNAVLEKFKTYGVQPEIS